MQSNPISRTDRSSRAGRLSGVAPASVKQFLLRGFADFTKEKKNSCG
jgi:hypothetical protein